MSWESVKGFARRRTQEVKEHFGNSSKTEDPAIDLLVTKCATYREVSAATAHRMAAIQNHLVEVANLLLLVKEDFEKLESIEELKIVARRIELVANDMKGKHATLLDAFRESVVNLNKVVTEGSQVRALSEDRKRTMLEYDFFRNKLVGLKANPPADHTRIPRNEARALEWKKALDDSTTRLMTFCQPLSQNCERWILVSSSTITAELGRYFEQVSISSKSVFGSLASSNVLPQEVQLAIITASAVLSNSATSNTVRVGPSVIEAPKSSRRFAAEDDPFKL